jgi:hypothetical protein
MAMKSYILPIILAVSSVAAAAQDCSKACTAYAEVEGAVSRLLSYPAYTSFDLKILNRSGDLAAIAIMKRVSLKDMDSPENARQVLLILRMAFESPQLIAGGENRKPTAALLLLEHLQQTSYARQSTNAVENVRFEVEHSSSTGQPLGYITLEGAAPIDMEHYQWVDSVLGWTAEIKPGMTRRDLLRVFTIEGGISFRTEQTFVLKGCPGIHVHVTFSPAANPQEPAGMPDDKILTISKPYLDSFHAD